MIPKNYENLNSTVIKVEYIKNEESGKTSKYSWRVTEFTDSEFTIQLDFEEPLLVSTGNVNQLNL